MKTRHWAPAFLAVIFAGIGFAAAGDGGWLHKVPGRDRTRPNPFAGEPDAPAAGAKIFAEHCASCHGDGAEGKTQGRRVKPSLRADRIRQATPGELFWLLTNGSQKNGMPAWSRLPDAQRWQLITYLKSLP